MTSRLVRVILQDIVNCRIMWRWWTAPHILESHFWNRSAHPKMWWVGLQFFTDMQVRRALGFPSVHTVLLRLLPLQKPPRKVELDKVISFWKVSISVPSPNHAFAIIAPKR
jgi:hypothetical protein